MPGLIADESVLSLIGYSHVFRAASSCVGLTVISTNRVLVVTVSSRLFLTPCPSVRLRASRGMPKYTETHVTTLVPSVRRMIGLWLTLK